MESSSSSSSLSSPTNPSTADYWIGPIVGQGAFAQVHYAKHKESKQPMAIKVVDQVTARKQPGLVQSLFQEKYLLSDKLRHVPWVIRLWSSFYDSQCVYMVLELCPGGDLQHLLERGMSTSVESKEDDTIVQQQHYEPWFWNAIPYYLSQLRQALDALHQEQVIHCDIKPANILLTVDHQIKLADFGSALDLTTATSTKPKAVSPRGTAEYAAPELLRNQLPGAQDIPPQAMDYWSFACVAVALHTGESPFARNGSEALTVQAIVDYATQRQNDEKDASSSSFLETHWNKKKHCQNKDDVDNDQSSKEQNVKYLDYSSTILPAFQGLLHPEPCQRVQAWQQQSNQNDDAKATTLTPPLPPAPHWIQHVETTELQDGARGWGVFFL